MAIFKRGRVYWYHFYFNGQHFQRSTKQGNPRVARQMEAAHRAALAKGEVGIVQRERCPTLKDFSPRFIDAVAVRCAAKPSTVTFYSKKLDRVLEFEALAQAPLDRIDEALIESFVIERRQKVSPASVNRELATLRRLLRLAFEWKVIQRVPRIHLLPGERCREFVLNHEQEQAYLNKAPQPLHDIAVMILDTGIRVGEALALTWRDIHLQPANGARYGYVHIREGKSRNAKRNLPLTARVSRMLERRPCGGDLDLVFSGKGGAPIPVHRLDQIHARIREDMKLPKDFVLHSLRHTMLTRIGESGADAFTIMRVAGHSTVVVSQRYVHPTPEAVESAFERLQKLNKKAAARLRQGVRKAKQLRPATFSATVSKSDAA